MNISSISYSSNNVLPQANNNDVIKLLEKQKEQLQEQLQKVKESKMDEKIKQEKVKQIQEQIEQIDTTFKQKQAEMINKSQKSDEQKSVQSEVSKLNDYEGGNGFAGMSDLIQANATYSQAKIMNGINNNLQGKGRVLAIEIKTDEGRGGKAISKRNELEKIEARETILDKKVAEVTQTVQEKIEEASKEGQDTNKTLADKDTENTLKGKNDSSDEQSSKVTNEREQRSQNELKEEYKKYKQIDIQI